MTILLGTGLLSAACSAEERTTVASSTGDAQIATARPDDDEKSASPAQQAEPAMLRERILISFDRGSVRAELADNKATRALVKMLPITIEMRDHLRQEKTGKLPSPLPEVPRQSQFAAGTLGLWGSNDFVIYYRQGLLPSPGIIVLGHVLGDVSIFDLPGPAAIRIQRTD